MLQITLSIVSFCVLATFVMWTVGWFKRNEKILFASSITLAVLASLDWILYWAIKLCKLPLTPLQNIFAELGFCMCFCVIVITGLFLGMEFPMWLDKRSRARHRAKHGPTEMIL